MTSETFRYLGPAMTVAALLALTGCEEEGPAEEAGEQIDQAMEESGEKLEEATDEMGGKLEEAGDKLRERTQ